MAGGSFCVKNVLTAVVAKIYTTSNILKAFIYFPLPSLSTCLFLGKGTYSLAPQVREMGYCNLACVHKFGRGDFILYYSA